MPRRSRVIPLQVRTYYDAILLQYEEMHRGNDEMPSMNWNPVLRSFELTYEDTNVPHPVAVIEPEAIAASEDVAPDTMTCPAGSQSCEACKAIRNDPTLKLKSGVVHQYSYRPTQWRRRSVTNDPDDFHFGIELETDNYAPGPGRNPTWMNAKRSPLGNDLAVDMRRPKTLWIAKSDSSVSGPEFVSHPATLAYWQSQKAQLGEMFKMLVHAGFRSHDNDKCGMHVNISRNAFDNADHLYKFLTLLYSRPAWALRMSQRTAESADHWAPLRGLETTSRRMSIAMRAFQDGRFTATTDKYSALNIPPASQGRVEFRLPRGTLRLDRFMKNLEWAHGMVSFTKDEARAPSECMPDKFMEYALADERYPSLAGYIEEKRDRLFRAATGRLTLAPETGE